jgi:serine/threonine-protein kinase
MCATAWRSLTRRGSSTATTSLAKIGDFGLAVNVARSRLTQHGLMVGTTAYMPPEQALGGEPTPQSDLYSLGCMLYEMVTGRPPFVGDESVAIIGQHLNTPPVAPTWHRPDCPPGLETLILRLLEKDAAKRPESVAAAKQALVSIQPERTPVTLSTARLPRSVPRIPSTRAPSSAAKGSYGSCAKPSTARCPVKARS